MWLEQSTVSTPAPEAGLTRCDRWADGRVSDTKAAPQVQEMHFFLPQLAR